MSKFLVLRHSVDNTFWWSDIFPSKKENLLFCTRHGLFFLTNCSEETFSVENWPVHSFQVSWQKYHHIGSFSLFIKAHPRYLAQRTSCTGGNLTSNFRKFTLECNDSQQYAPESFTALYTSSKTHGSGIFGYSVELSYKYKL